MARSPPHARESGLSKMPTLPRCGKKGFTSNGKACIKTYPSKQNCSAEKKTDEAIGGLYEKSNTNAKEVIFDEHGKTLYKLKPQVQ